MRGAARKVKGVIDATVDLKGGAARVVYDPAVTGPQQIANAISATGFQARVRGK